MEYKYNITDDYVIDEIDNYKNTKKLDNIKNILECILKEKSGKVR